MIKSKKYSIGIFGGSFDPPHKGHLKITLLAIKKFNLKKVYWTVTKKNPFKKKSLFTLEQRVHKCKKILQNKKNIQVKYLENRTKSDRTIDTIKYLKKKNPNNRFYLIVGSDNLITFHKWKSWKNIVKISKLLVFSRKGYDQKAKKSVIVESLNNQNIIFVKNKKLDISSTKIRKKLKKNN